MQPEQVAGRQRGQIALIMALAVIGLLGMTGVAVDLGYAYTHRREVQNAADAAALAGATKLGQHYLATKNSGGIAPTPTPAPQTDATILQDVTNAAMYALPPFPAAPADQTWPPAGTAGTNTLTAYYMTSDAAQGPQITSAGSAPPANAVGVRVVATVSYSTFFAKVLGSAFATVPVTGQARAMLRPVAGIGPGAPFIVCGGGMSGSPSYGADVVGPPGDPDVGSERQILLTPTTAGQPASIRPQYVGNVFLVHGSQLNNDNGDCGDNGFHGNADTTDTCDPRNPPNVLPCGLDSQTGVSAGPIRNLVAGLPGCANISTANGCVMVLPVADGIITRGTMEVVGYASFVLYQGDHLSNVPGCNSNCHTAVLLGASMIDGAAGTGTIDPNNPGTFTLQLAPE